MGTAASRTATIPLNKLYFRKGISQANVTPGLKKKPFGFKKRLQKRLQKGFKKIVENYAKKLDSISICGRISSCV